MCIDVIDVEAYHILAANVAVAVSKGEIVSGDIRSQKLFRHDKALFYLIDAVLYGDPALNYESILETVRIDFVMVVPRYVSHQLVRHRQVSWYQESQRWSENRLRAVLSRLGIETDETTEIVNRLTGIDVSDETIDALRMGFCIRNVQEAQAALDALIHYYRLRAKYPAQLARAVLPQNVLTTLYGVTNLREWLHIMTLRLSPKAQPETRKAVSLVSAKLSSQGIPVWHMFALKTPQAYLSALRIGAASPLSVEKWLWDDSLCKPSRKKHVLTQLAMRSDLPKELYTMFIELADNCVGDGFED